MATFFRTFTCFETILRRFRDLTDLPQPPSTESNGLTTSHGVSSVCYAVCCVARALVFFPSSVSVLGLFHPHHLCIPCLAPPFLRVSCACPCLQKSSIFESQVPSSLKVVPSISAFNRWLTRGALLPDALAPIPSLLYELESFENAVNGSLLQRCVTVNPYMGKLNSNKKNRYSWKWSAPGYSLLLTLISVT